MSLSAQGKGYNGCSTSAITLTTYLYMLHFVCIYITRYIEY